MKIELSSLRLIREGKAKKIYEIPSKSDWIVQQFKDDATAFNALKKGQILNKGKINNQMSSRLFSWLEQSGIRTHFVEQLDDTHMVTRRLEMIPVEVVVRNKAAGSLCKRLGLPKGKALTPSLVEYFYKSDELGDPLIAESHIFYFKWATATELTQMTKVALEVNKRLESLFSDLGLWLVDFKLEFGRVPHSSDILLADEITLDGMRLWDKVTLESKDKDRFRFDLGLVEEGYQEVFTKVMNHLKP